MSYRITIICDRPLPGGELCGRRLTAAVGPGVTTGEVMVRAHEQAHREGWAPVRGGGWVCPGPHPEVAGE